MKKRLLCLLLVIVTLTALFTVSANAAVTDSGTCGAGKYWTLNNKTLSISGYGAMNDYHYETYKNAPWLENYSSQITSIDVKEGITHIGDYAFYSVYKATSLSLPSTLTSIGDSAFFGTALTEIDIPAGVTEIGANAFKNTQITSITLPNGLTSISDSLFSVCPNLKDVSIPDSVTSIGYQAFYYCHQLKSIEIPDSVTTIGKRAFCDCPALDTIDLPDSLTEIQSETFLNCTNLRKVIIPESVTTIATDAFEGCPSYLSIIAKPGSYAETFAKEQGYTFYPISEDGHAWNKLDVTIDDIGEPISEYGIADQMCMLHSGEYYITEFRFIAGPEIRGTYDNVGGVVTFTGSGEMYDFDEVPAAWTIIESMRPSEVTPITQIKFGDGITYIGAKALYCMENITSVTIPASVTEISDSAFANSSLETIRYAGSTACWNKLFSNVALGSVSVQAERSDHNWDAGVETPADCVNDGYLTQTCTVCGATKETKTETAGGHSAGEWTVTKQPTCTQEGTKIRVCTGCSGNKETAVVPALGHKYGNWSTTKAATCTEKGQQKRVCANDATHVEYKDISATGHSWNKDYTVDKEATLTTDGEKSIHCKNCTATKNTTVIPSKGSGTANPFVDNKDTSSYYYKPVIWAFNGGVTTGTSDTTFAPDAICTRSQVVTFLWRAAGSPAPKSDKNPFTDVQKGWYYNAVLWAVENGITNGTSATTFSPDATMTRDQFVTFLWRVAGSPKMTLASPFSDVAAGQYYTDAVIWAVKNGIANGTGDGYFSPGMGCSRGQTVTFLYRYYQGATVTAPAGIVLNKTSLAFDDFTRSYQLTGVILPDAAANGTITWTSSNPKVAKVSSDGTVTAVGEGSATITATCGTAVARCAVTYKNTVDMQNYMTIDYHEVKDYWDFRLTSAYGGCFVDAQGHKIVATVIKYTARAWTGVAHNYEHVTFRNLSTNNEIEDPVSYYEKLKDRAFGAKKLMYMELQTEALQVKLNKYNFPYYSPNSYGIMCKN